MKTAKEISLISLFTALLIGGQAVFSLVLGVEIVSLIFISFCFFYGRLRGMILATAFSLLRCMLFGFFPQTIILYLLYFNLISLLFGSLGKVFNREVNFKKLIIIVSIAVVSTALFTVLDSLISWLIFSFTFDALKVYFLASVPVMITQMICVFVTLSLFFIPLLKLYKKINIV